MKYINVQYVCIGFIFHAYADVGNCTHRSSITFITPYIKMLRQVIFIIVILPYAARNGSHPLGGEFSSILPRLGGSRGFQVITYIVDDDYSEGLNVAKCPHLLFKMKHLCPMCRDPADALAFSKNVRVGRHAADYNTVILGQVQFNLHNGRICMSTPARVMKCNLLQSWCVLLGDLCYTNHTLVHGHLFHKDIRCDD